MINPMLQNLTQNNVIQNISQIKQTMNAIKSVQNPQAMLESYAMQNPSVRQALDFVKSNGCDPEKCFYQLADKMGVNPEDVLNALK